MYYMKSLTRTTLPRSVTGLLGLVRAGLAAAEKSPTRVLAVSWPPPPAPLNATQLLEVARQWRARAGEGDPGADSVAQALETVASARRAR